MKIAFVGQKGIPATQGGVERHVEEVAVRMTNMGHDVFVYTRNNYTSKKVDKFKGVNIVYLPSIATKNLDAITHTFVSIVHIIFSRYDVVHFHGIGPTSLSFLVKIFKPSTALIGTFHCQDYYHQKWGRFAQRYLKFGEYMTCKIPDQTIVVSKGLATFVEEKYKKTPKTIPNGADVEKTNNANALSIWGLEKEKYILNVGRLIKHKGVHYLIEAFKQLEDTNRLPSDFKLVIVGEGSYTDDYVKYLYTISEGRKNIVFTGKQSGENLQQLFSHAYLFVQPSEAEGLSIALLEAMDYGLTPVISDIKENLEPAGEFDCAFKSMNIESLADKLAYLVNSPNEVKRIGMLAKEKIRREYSWSSVAERIVDQYRGVVLSKNNK